MRKVLRPATLTSVFLALLAVTGAAAQPVPLGPAFRVDLEPDGRYNNFPRVGSSAAGDFVVVWRSEAGAGSQPGLYGRSFRRDGEPRGGEFRVDEGHSSFVDYPALTVGPFGNFIAAWMGTSDNDTNIFARRFLADGTPRAAEVQVNERTAGFQGPPDIVFLPNLAEYVVVWPSVEPEPWGADLWARRFNRHDRPLRRERRVNQARRHNQAFGSVAALADGFVVAWDNIRYDVQEFGITTRLFDRFDRALTRDLKTNVVEEGYQVNPQVASAARTGHFGVVWQSTASGGDSFEIVARLFDREGRPLTDEFQVNTEVAGDQRGHAVAMTPQGDFVVAWHSQPFATLEGEIRARWFYRDGTPRGGEVVVAQGLTGWPDVAVDSRGNFVVVWTAREEGLVVDRVFGRRFSAPSNP